jgi:hypothetical protein
MRHITALNASADARNRWLSRVFGLLAVLLASPLRAQVTGKAPAYTQPPNLLLRWAAVVLVFVGIWFILYKVVYPFLLRFYRDDFCKTIFWTLFILYSFTWAFLASYILLEFGFYYGWLQWFAAFLAVLWLISGLVLLLRRHTA